MQHEGKSILVLDDDPMFRSLVKKLLEAKGFGVNEASRPDQALVTPDTVLLIVDYRMPQMDGISWITKLRESHKDLPIIFCSALPCDTSMFNWLRNILKVSLTVKKPIKPLEFVAQVESLVRDYLIMLERKGVTSIVAKLETECADCSESTEPRVLDVSPNTQTASDSAAEDAFLDAEIERAIAEARTVYLSKLSSDWQIMFELLFAYECNHARLDFLNLAAAIAHKMRGTAGTFGLTELGGIAGELEYFTTLLVGKPEEDADEIRQELMEAVRRGQEEMMRIEEVATGEYEAVQSAMPVGELATAGF